MKLKIAIALFLTLSRFKGKNSNDLSEWSHNFIGWKNTKTSAIINYKYAKELNI